jgi:hypothetical protein
MGLNVQKMKSDMGMRKHGKSGKTVNSQHFTGKSGSTKVRKKGDSRKKRKLKRGTHKNKYAHLKDK